MYGKYEIFNLPIFYYNTLIDSGIYSYYNLQEGKIILETGFAHSYTLYDVFFFNIKNKKN